MIWLLELLDPIRRTRSAIGTQLDPHSSWMIGRSLETVNLRMHRGAESASQVANWLSEHSRVETVSHPEHKVDERYQAVYEAQCGGGGSTFSFSIDGGRETVFKVLNKLRLFKLAVSLARGIAIDRLQHQVKVWQPSQAFGKDPQCGYRILALQSRKKVKGHQNEKSPLGKSEFGSVPSLLYSG